MLYIGVDYFSKHVYLFGLFVVQQRVCMELSLPRVRRVSRQVTCDEPASLTHIVLYIMRGIQTVFIYLERCHRTVLDIQLAGVYLVLSRIHVW